MAKLVRVDEKTYARLHKLAGKIQAVNGKRTSLCDAIDALLDNGPAVVKKSRAKKEKQRRARHGHGTHAHELVPYFQRREIH